MLLKLLGRQFIKTKSDLDLVDMVRSGNSQALGELFNRYNFKIYGVCLKYMADVEIAKDQLMHIFEVLPKKLEVSKIENFGGWLYRVSKNECLMKLRKKRQTFTSLQDVQLEDDSQESLDLSNLNEKQLTTLEESIELLKYDQKRCIEYFYLKNKSYKEIESIGEYSIKEIKSHIQNGKRKLKLIITEKHPSLEI